MKRILWVPFFLAVLSPSTAEAEERGRVDLGKPIIAGLSSCLTSIQLDCLESVTIVLKDGKRLVANQVSVDNQAEKDEQEQVIESGVSTWEYINTSGVSNSFILKSKLTTPAYLISGSNDSVGVNTKSESEAEGESDTESEAAGESETESTTTEDIRSDTRVYEPSLSVTAIFSGGSGSSSSKKLLNDERLEIVIRTSWLQIEEVFLPGKDSEIEIEKTTQGQRITLRGSVDLIIIFEKRKNLITQVVTETPVTKENFEFLILHPKSNTGEKQCFEDGYMVSATNGWSLSPATEIQDYTLKFSASGYPIKPDKSANRGYAKVRTSLSWLACKYPGNDFIFATDFTAKVYSAEGGLKLQNTSASAIVKDGFLEVRVDEFLFAKTEIWVVADPSGIASQKAKAEAELKAKQEAEAKAAAELKAKQEAEAAAELKAKQEAEAKAAAELKAKQEAEAKAAAELKAKQEAAAKAAAAKKTTITCTKGKLTKKVTAVKPKCPKGYKVKK